jgi:hypothetical protein
MSTKKKIKPVFVPAAPDELQIDLDQPRARIPKRLLRLVSEHVKIKSVKYNRSKSGNTHVSIRIEPNSWSYTDPADYGSMLEKLFLQAALGSDPVRELLSWGRARNGCPYPTLFFENSLDKPRRKA